MTEDFFDPLPEPSEPDPYEPPRWMQPPFDELAWLVPERRILARSDRGVVVLLSHIDVYRDGCSFRIRSIARRRLGMDDAEWHELHEIAMHGDYRRGHGGVPGDLLRFGVQFEDGRKATTSGGPWDGLHHDGHTRGPVLTQHGSGGSGSDRTATLSLSLWLWPLPPAEPFDLVVAWPAVGVQLTRTTLSGRDVVEAAESATALWPDDVP